MGANTKISWAQATWNPITGCTPESEGCAHCYAAGLVKRFPALHKPGVPFSTPVYHSGRMDAPLHWRKPRRIFVGSMTDMFHEDVNIFWLLDVLDFISRVPHHTFMFLTKRPARMKTMLADIGEKLPSLASLPNLWLGVTAENQQRADERIPVLLGIPAAKRFVSIEPMLGPIDLRRVQWPGRHRVDVLRGGYWEDRDVFFKGFVNHSDMNKLDLVIVGAETGPGKRPMDPVWALDIRDQCEAAEVPFFFKKDSEGGSTLDGREYREIPR